MCMSAIFFPAHFVRFLFSFFCRFLYFLFSFMKMKAFTVCANVQASIFYGLLAIQSQKLLTCWTSLNDISEQMVKSRDFRRKTKEWKAVLFVKMCKICDRKSCNYMRNNSTSQKGKQKPSQFESFEHNGMKIYDQQRMESLEEKKAAHMQTWCEKHLETL